MKTKRLKSNLVHELNKKTIAHLSRREMVQIKTGDGQINQAVDQYINFGIYTAAGPTCNTGTSSVDTGIPPDDKIDFTI